jgi:hypothetical protein
MLLNNGLIEHIEYLSGNKTTNFKPAPLKTSHYLNSTKTTLSSGVKHPVITFNFF